MNKNITSLKQGFILVLSLLSAPCFAGLLCEGTTQKLLKSSGQSLRESLRTLELAYTQAQAAVQSQEEPIQSIKDRLNAQRQEQGALWRAMGFRERYLGGHLLGRKDLVASHAAKVAEVTRTEQELAREERTLKRLKKEPAEILKSINHEIASWLVFHDHHFSELRILESKLDQAQCEGEFCLDQIEEASEALSSAQAYETWDAISKSKAASFASYAGVYEAEGELKEVKRAVRAFNEVLKRLDSHVQTLKSGHVDDSFDLIFDFLINPAFDFTSWGTLSALSEADDSLEDLRAEVGEVLDKIKDDLFQLRQQIKNILCEARGLCASAPPK